MDPFLQVLPLLMFNHGLVWCYHAGLECVSIAKDIGNGLLRTASNNCTAACLLHLGEYQRALALAEASYSASPKGLLWQPFIPLTLGEAALALGDFERAFNMIEESSQIMLKSRPAVASVPLSSLSLAALSLGEQEEAEAYLKQALSLAMETKMELQVRRALIAGAALMASKGQQLQANRLFNLASGSPHVSNSEWYRTVSARFLEQDANQVNEDALGADESRPVQQTVWQAAESYVQSIS